MNGAAFSDTDQSQPVTHHAPDFLSLALFPFQALIA
jgi:hypothetical protein